MTLSEAASWAQAVGSILSVFVTLWIAFQVSSYSKKKDKSDVVQAMWLMQQHLNIATLGSDQIIKASEMMVYGKVPSNEMEAGRLNFEIFFMLNRVRHLFEAYNNGIFSRKEFRNLATGTLMLIVAQRDRVEGLLRTRGYEPEFIKEVRELLEKISPPHELSRDGKLHRDDYSNA